MLSSTISLLLWGTIGVGIPHTTASIINPQHAPRRVPVWPAPVPADTIGPIDWSSLPPSPYSRPRQKQSPLKITNTNLKLTATTQDTTLPQSVDWRNRSLPSSPTRPPKNFITTPQNQGICQSCWAFAVTALIESMIRIEHGIWSKRSEADIHDGVGASCESTGNTESTLSFVAGLWDEIHLGDNSTGEVAHGVSDWACDPYEDSLHGYEACEDRRGRAAYIPVHYALGTVEDQKRWVDEYGPVVATFVLYGDFQNWKGGGGGKRVYMWDGKASSNGNHIALVVGYDDGVGEEGAWILKNSWGTGWGDGGFVYFGYGQANIDGWTKYGVYNVSPDPWSRKRHQSGNMMQSNNGDNTHRNFELLLASPSSAALDNTTSTSTFTHLSRDGIYEKWSVVSRAQAEQDGTNIPRIVGQPTIVGTSFNGGEFHAIARDSESNVQHWVLTNTTWKLGSAIKGAGASAAIDGHPGFIQADDSSLVMAVRHSDGSLQEWQRQPPSKSNPSPSWNPRSMIAKNIVQSGPSFLQSNIGQNLYDPKGTTATTANLYVVAIRTDGKMQLFWRPGLGSNANSTTAPISWSPGEIFGSANYTISDGPGPIMIQTFSNTINETSIGDFHLVVATPKTGYIQHWRRNNDDIHLRAPSSDGNGKWELIEETTGGKPTKVESVWSLVQGSFNERMHMITEQTDGTFVYWEWDSDGQEGKRWAVVENLSVLIAGG